MQDIRRILVIAAFFLPLLTIIFHPILNHPSTVSAQTVDSSTETWITLPRTWKGPASISQAEIDATMPPLVLLDHQGEFTLTRIDNAESPHFRVQRTSEEQASDMPGLLRFGWISTGRQLAKSANQSIVVTFEARGYAPSAGASVFIEEDDGETTSSTSLYIDDVAWKDYSLSRVISPETTEIRIGIEWAQALGPEWLEFSPLDVKRIPTTELSHEVSPTDTSTPTPGFIVVTSTPTPPDVFAAATSVAQAMENARTTGTATATPANMQTATFTPTPIVVTATPTPGNQETATTVALEADALAFTTGTPTPFPEDVTVLVVTPAGDAKSQRGQPTPLFIPLQNIPATRTPTPTPIFPSQLVGKIVFKANLSGDNRRPDYMIMNPDSTDVGRLTGTHFYGRAAERDHYSGDRGFYASVAKEQDGFRRIQIFYDFVEYGTKGQLTYFGAGTAWDPAWSPINEQVVMVSNENKNDEIWIVERGEWPAIQLTDNDWEWDNHPSFSPDGSQIVFMSNRNSGRRQLWIMDADGSNQRQLTDFPFEAWDPVWVKYAD